MNEAFAHALKNDTVSKLEMSWSMKTTPERLDELLNGAEYNETEELFMYRFIFKVRNKRLVLNVGPVVPSPEKTNGI